MVHTSNSNTQGRQRQVNVSSRSACQPGLKGEFQDSQCYTGNLCLEKNKNNNNKNKQTKEKAKEVKEKESQGVEGPSLTQSPWRTVLMWE